MATLTVKENGLTYKLLKKQIELDIKNKSMDWSEQYPYRLNQINIFDDRRITAEEAAELRATIEPFKPAEEVAEEA